MVKDTSILAAYKIWVMTNGNVKIIKAMTYKQLEDLRTLKVEIQQRGIFSHTGYDNFVNWLCDTFKIECCYTCNEYFFLSDLDCCVSCDEFICDTCKDNGCNCGHTDYDEDNDLDDIMTGYYLL